MFNALLDIYLSINPNRDRPAEKVIQSVAAVFLFGFGFLFVYGYSAIGLQMVQIIAPDNFQTHNMYKMGDTSQPCFTSLETKWISF